jgi:type IV pilus assembly protein PilY1
MKPLLQIAVSALALAGVLLSVASQATQLSELPLKASVLAKPNVILGFDDSGSMDSEVMLDSADGVFWWNFDLGTGWDNTGRLHRNVGSGWSSTWRRYFYLFPNGNGTGLNIKPDNQFGDWSLPPTSQFAWARSADYNPQYYNPAVTYQSWATANGAGYTFSNATATAARGHPVWGGGTNVVDLTATRAANENASRYFMAVRGTTLPAGARRSVCDANNANCSAWADVGATDVAAAASSVTRLAMAYWPATYWVRATGAFDCTLSANTVSVAARDCVPAPDGQKLRRVEIRSTNATYPSGRTYAAELQNFANWFQYHRKRRLSTNAAMGEALENLTGLNMGVVLFNARPADTTRVTMFDLDNASAASNGQAVLRMIYDVDSNVGTPTRETLRRIGHEFLQAAGPIKFACQRNAALIVTDGYASAVDVVPPVYTSATWGAGAPFATTFAGTLADIALSYYTNTLGANTFTAGRVPTNPSDLNPNLHMNTYALTLGAMGDLFRGASTLLPTNTNAWVDPSADFSPTAVDDLWHATINGRGKMFLAVSASETGNLLQQAFGDILDQNGAQGGIAVSNLNLARGDNRAYLATYNPRGWSGDLTANPIDAGTGVVSSTPTWRAAGLLAARDWTTRNIFTSSSSAGVDFNPTNTGLTQAVVDHLRGSRVGEGDTLRQRTNLMGAIVNSEPVIARDEQVVYVGSGSGMLHAFDTVTGAEQWAYAPPDALVRMGQSAQRGWVYQTLFDATPAYGRLANGNKLLVSGLGAAGRSYFALDVTTPRGITAAQAQGQFRWTFPAASDATLRGQMGFTTGKPVIARTASGVDHVLVTSGYSNGQTVGDGKGRLWVLNPATGAVVKTFQTTTGTTVAEAGLSAVAAFRESDGTARYVYGGDLLGNVWRFDLTLAGAGPHNGELLATLRDATGTAQPVTTTPELVTISGRRVVLVGTGRLLDFSDTGKSAVQSFYAFADDGGTLTDARTGLVPRTYSRGTHALTGGAVNWTTQRGWYFDLPASEHANTDPFVAYGAVSFATNVNGGNDCSQSSFLYQVDLTSGLKVAELATVSQLISSTANSSRVITLLTASTAINPNGLLKNVTHLSDNTTFGDSGLRRLSVSPSKNAWREVRR